MGILFTLPVAFLIGSLLLIPIGQTFYYSFTNWDGFTSQWIGFTAYTNLFHNPEFVTVLENNAVMLLALVHVLGVLLMSIRQRENLVRAMITGWKRSASAGRY